eukprot:296987-Chlamydomonas_euryale.AAC.1
MPNEIPSACDFCVWEGGDSHTRGGRLGCMWLGCDALAGVLPRQGQRRAAVAGEDRAPEGLCQKGFTPLPCSLRARPAHEQRG